LAWHVGVTRVQHSELIKAAAAAVNQWENNEGVSY
jgi:hypothetical protein